MQGAAIGVSKSMSSLSGNNPDQISIAISACLLGEPVRYDGGHKYVPEIVNALKQSFDLIPICPEVAIGLGVPRPPIKLVQTEIGIRAKGVVDPDIDVTSELNGYGVEIGDKYKHISGYVFKARSPSCGVISTPVLNESGVEVITGTGIFANAVVRALPRLPVAEETELLDIESLKEFIERVLAYHQTKADKSSG